MSYQIIVEGLRLPVLIGLYGHEQQAEQVIECHLVLTMQSEQAASTDAIEDTLNYGDLCEELVALVKTRSYKLLERMADDLMHHIAKHNGVEHIDIRLIKRNPGVLPHCQGAGICMQRTCS